MSIFVKWKKNVFHQKKLTFVKAEDHKNTIVCTTTWKVKLLNLQLDQNMEFLFLCSEFSNSQLHTKQNFSLSPCYTQSLVLDFKSKSAIIHINQGCAPEKFEGSPVCWTCKTLGAQHMICTKNLRFSSHPS